MSVRQALRFTQETTAGAFPATPPAGTQTILRMTDPVTDQPKPIMWTIRDAGGSNRRVQNGSAQNDIKIKVRCPLYYSQAKLLLPAFFTPTGTLPGLTTFSIDRFLVQDDSSSTKFYTRLLGCTPETIAITANNQGQGVIAMMDMTFVAMDFNHTITVTDFATPALTDYPSDQPVTMQQLAGQVTVGASTGSFKSFNLTLKNNLDAIYDESRNPQAVNFYGSRDCDWKMDFRLKTTGFRTDYESVTAETMSVAFTDGTNTITFNCGGKNFLQSLDDQLPLDKAFYQTVSGAVHLDSAAGTDVTLTIAP